MAHKFTSAVIGLGQIGQGYDYDWPDNSRVLTHASGFHYHDFFRLVGGVDPNPESRMRFEKKYKRPTYDSIEALFLQESPQILSLAVPTQLHHTVFKKIIEHHPLAVICEKPIAASLKEALNMLTLSEKHNCVLLINYMRRFDPGVLSVKKAIDQGEIGDIYKGVVWYSKGLINNGSHFIDLLIYLLGDVYGSEIIETGRRWNSNDAEPDIRLHFKKASIYFLSAREECFSLNNMRLIGTQGEIQYAKSGNEISIRKTQPHPDYPEYHILKPNHDLIYNDLKRYQWHVLEQLKNNLIDGTPINSDGISAVKTMKVIENIFSEL